MNLVSIFKLFAPEYSVELFHNRYSVSLRKSLKLHKIEFLRRTGTDDVLQLVQINKLEAKIRRLEATVESQKAEIQRLTKSQQDSTY